MGSSSCPLLSRVDFSSCRLVSRVAFSSCPSLRRVDFSSCNSGVESPFRVATRESSRFFELQLGSRVDFEKARLDFETVRLDLKRRESTFHSGESSLRVN